MPDIITAIIIDDEQNSRDTLRMMLHAVCPEVKIAGEAKNITEGKKLISKQRPKIVFLDIQMPGGTGFDLLQSLDKMDFKVIFTTAYNEYAVQAFRYSALDYLLKPIHPEDLRQAVAKVTEPNMGQLEEQLELLKSHLIPPVPNPQNTPGIIPKKIALPTMEGIHFVLLEDIVWCEALGGYTKFHIRNAAPIVISRLIKDYEDLFSSYNFIRVHNSSLINVVHVVKYVRGEGGQLWMVDGSEIEVSRRRKEQLLSVLADINLSAGKI
jgi:two-component system LytT family response regulator